MWVREHTQNTDHNSVSTEVVVERDKNGPGPRLMEDLTIVDQERTVAGKTTAIN